jgi:hypothetical protein
VQVLSNDEIGYTGDAINEMTNGLIEREKMQLSLNLAKEVQQNLLPKGNLNVDGFDIAGKSVYCTKPVAIIMILSLSMTLMSQKFAWPLGMFPDMVFPLLYSWPLFVLLCGSGPLCRAALPRSFLM